MNIDVQGPNFGKPYSESVANKIRGAIAVMTCKLGIAHEPVHYEVLLGRTINKFDNGCRGWAYASKNRGKWTATIFVAREESLEDMLSTVAHELIHIKQFIKDGLDLNINQFKGKRWAARKNQDEDYDSPWEREAYGKEVALKEHFLKYLEKNL
jgi:hypothetical protein